MNHYGLAAALLAGCAGHAAAQPVSEQLDPEADQSTNVKIVGHVVKPVSQGAGEDRLQYLNTLPGFEVNVFAEDLVNPRMLAVSEDGAVYVTRRSVGDVVRLEDEDGDGVADTREVVANRPEMHGIAISGSTIYLVTVHDIYKAPIEDDGSLGELERIVDDLPDAGQHPNRTIVVGPDDMLYVSVGSTCNACAEPNPENATLLQVAPDGSQRTIYASGLRNTIGFGFVPDTGDIYGMDHGIDWLGDNEQHEELNRIVQGQEYGWPYIYADGLFNPADQPPDPLTWEDWAEQSQNPVGLYVPHAAPMQMDFYTGNQFPEDFQGDAFVAMRGSWNRQPPSGYEVVRIDFENGEPVGFEPFVTGFLTRDDNSDWRHLGRLAGLAQTQDGGLLFSDDSNGIIYRVSYTGEGDEETEGGLQPTNAEGADVRMLGDKATQPEESSLSQLAIDAVESEAAGLDVNSPAFDDGSSIPSIFAAEQQNFSPPLQWQEGPSGTKSYAVVMEDPDAPGDSPFVHWLIYNIPADVHQLHPGVPGAPILPIPENALQGENSRGSLGYFGPRPPKQDDAHHYHFEVFALDQTLDLPHGATRDELITAMQGHVLAADQLVGTYSR